jgi:hypothetical protein
MKRYEPPATSTSDTSSYDGYITSTRALLARSSEETPEAIVAALTRARARLATMAEQYDEVLGLVADLWAALKGHEQQDLASPAYAKLEDPSDDETDMAAYFYPLNYSKCAMKPRSNKFRVLRLLAKSGQPMHLGAISSYLCKLSGATPGNQKAFESRKTFAANTLKELKHRGLVTNIGGGLWIIQPEALVPEEAAKFSAQMPAYSAIPTSTSAAPIAAKKKAARVLQPARR